VGGGCTLCASVPSPLDVTFTHRATRTPYSFPPGFLGVFCNQVLFLYGVKLTNATVASIVHLTLPLFAAALAVGFGMVGLREWLANTSPTANW
jgi:drug/metabolite transporter (DMT)-like permease